MENRLKYSELTTCNSVADFPDVIDSLNLEEFGDITDHLSPSDDFNELFNTDASNVFYENFMNDADPLVSGPDLDKSTLNGLASTLPLDIMQHDHSPNQMLTAYGNDRSSPKSIPPYLMPGLISSSPPLITQFKSSPSHMSTSPPQNINHFLPSQNDYTAMSRSPPMTFKSSPKEHVMTKLPNFSAITSQTQTCNPHPTTSINHNVKPKIAPVSSQSVGPLMYSLLNSSETPNTISLPSAPPAVGDIKRTNSILHNTLANIDVDSPPVKSTKMDQRFGSGTNENVVPRNTIITIMPPTAANQTTSACKVYKVIRPAQQSETVHNLAKAFVKPLSQPAPNIQPVVTTQQLEQILLNQPNTATSAVVTPPHNIPTVVSRAITISPASSTTPPKVPIERIVSTPIPIKPDGKLNEHRIIEKRYRSKINTALNDLKDLVCGTDQKLHKAQIMTKAVDYIKHLIKKNKKLQAENLALKKEAQTNAINAGILAMKNIQTLPIQDIMEVQNSPSSDATSPLSSVSPLRTDSDSSPMYSPAFDEITLDTDLPNDMDFSHMHMIDKSRFVFMIAFCVLAFNPFRSLFTVGGDERYDRPLGGRSLQSLPYDSPMSTAVTALSWAMTGVVILFVLLKLLVFGEPYTDRKSKAAATYDKHRKLAEINSKKGDLQAASHHLSLCLAALGRPLPTSKLDLATSLAWQLFHHVMQRCRVKSVLTRLIGRIWRMTYINRMESANDAAFCYHALHEMYLTGDHPVSGMQGINLCLGAINMAESAGTTISTTLLTRIYATAAIHIRSIFTKRLHFTCRYFLMSARRVISTHHATVTPFLHWIIHPVGHNYFIHGSWTLDKCSSLFTTTRGYESPISRVSRCFYDNLANTAVNLLVTTDPSVTQKTVHSEVLECVQLMGNAGYYGDEFDEPVDLINNKDAVCQWWCSVIRVALSWRRGVSQQSADEYTITDIDYGVTDHFPKQLVSRQDNLAMAVYVSYRARKVVMTGVTDETELIQCEQLCRHAGVLIRQNLNMLSAANTKPESSKMAMQLLVVEWLLQTRLEVWRLQQGASSESLSVELKDVSGYQQDLEALRKLAKYYRPALIQLPIHEAMYRVMCGANPLKTQQLFNKSLKKSKSKSSSSDNDEATYTDTDQAKALVLSCEYLPDAMLSAPGEKTSMLADAVELYKRIGDTHSAQHYSRILSRHVADKAITAY